MSFHAKNKWIVGLTGPMLGGKSTALTYFAKQGAGVISCDEIVRQLYTRPLVFKRVNELFKVTNLAALTRLVFDNDAARKRLEQYLHPLVLKEVKAQIKKASQPLVVVEVPLLFEAGWASWTDLNIAVLANPATLATRLKSRGITRAEYMRRSRYQLPDIEKACRADVVFFHTTRTQLKKSVERFCHVFNLLHNSK